MPHLNLEYTANIIEKNNVINLFKECHTALANMLPTNIENCKSRATELTTYYLGTGDDNNALVHVTLQIMPGRTLELRTTVAEELMQILTTHFQQSLEQLNLQISLSIIELPQPYLKITSK